MVFSRALFLSCSVLAVTVACGGSAMAQAPLPAYSSLASIETATRLEGANVMGRLRELRTLRRARAARQIQTAPALSGVATMPAPVAPPSAAPKDAVEEPMIIFDGPVRNKATKVEEPTQPTKKSKTKKSSKKKMAHQAVYLDNGEQETSSGRPWYDVLDQDEDESIWDALARTFGGQQPAPGDRRDLPRAAMATRYDQSAKSDRAGYSRNPMVYPGQPLSAYNSAVQSGQVTEMGPQYAIVTDYGPTNRTNLKNGGPAGRTVETTTNVPGDYEWESNATAPASTPEPRQHVLKGPKESYEGYVKDLSPAENAGGPQYGSTAIPLDDAGAIDSDRRWGVFATGDALFGNQENVKNVGSTRMSAGGFSVGVDYQVLEKSFIGLALTYVSESAKIIDSGKSDGDSVMVSLYGTTEYMDDVYADGFLSLGTHSFDNRRIFGATTPTPVTAESNPDGFSFSARAETGYNMRRGNVTLTPFAGLSLAYADLDKYEETGMAGMNHAVDSIDHWSVISSLGGQVSRTFGFANGGAMSPSLRMAYNHEFGGSATDVDATIIGAPITFTTKGVKRSRDWVSFAPSFTASFPSAWQLRGGYTHDFFRKDVNEHLFNMSAQYRW